MKFPPPMRVPDLSAVPDRYVFCYEPLADGSWRMRKPVRRRLDGLFKRVKESGAKLDDPLIGAFMAKLRREAIERHNP